jgi:sulfatase maturation enzyme AslB (radical SAM superfamily)
MELFCFQKVDTCEKLKYGFVYSAIFTIYPRFLIGNIHFHDLQTLIVDSVFLFARKQHSKDYLRRRCQCVYSL